jgi:hypothetical protein
MNNNFSDGRIPNAQYRDPGLDEYRNNPLICALPPVYSLNEVVAGLKIYPHFDDKEIYLDGRLRVHAIARILHSFFQPLNHHLELENKVSLLIRQGYLGRNPTDGSRYEHLQNGYARVVNEDLDAKLFDGVISTANSLSLFGCSGCGKSRALERILSMYPLAIYHPEHHITQLTYLKIDCPIDGDLDELCLSFFSQVDRVLGTRYSQSHGRKKLGTKRLLASMCQIANLHALGVLIIDEVQNLNEARSGGAEKMHNFFVSLVNTIGVPVIQVGTHRARKFFQRTFRAARRISGIGSLFWDRLARDKQWKELLKKIWQYQWLKNAEPLNDELEATMYDLSQGVMDIVVKLFVLAQIRAIVTRSERITSALLRKVYDDEFAPVHPMLAALRSNRPDIIAKYDDLLMPEIEAKMLSIIGNLNESLPDKSEQIRSSDDAKTKRLLALLAQMDIPSDIAIPMVDDVLRKHPDLPITALINKVTAYSVAEEKTSPKISIIKHSEWSSLPSDDLRYLYVSSQKNKVYEEFKKHGLVFNLQSLLH